MNLASSYSPISHKVPSVVLLTRLRALRERKGLTQAELAQAAGLSAVAISRLENGQAQSRPSTLRKLAKALGVKPEVLSEPLS